MDFFMIRAFVVNIETRNLAFTNKDSLIIYTRYCFWPIASHRSHLNVTGTIGFIGNPPDKGNLTHGFFKETKKFETLSVLID